MSTTTEPRRSEWIVPAALVLLSLVPAAFGTARLAELARGAEITEANARFFAMPLPVVLHILVVIPYSMLGAFQFAPGFRRRHREWHRAAGRVLVLFGLVAALTGLWMAHFYPWPEGDGEIVYVLRLVFGSAMALSIVLAVAAIRRRDFASHGAWMIRGYAIGLGAGTQVLTHLPWVILVGTPGELSRAVLMGAGWVINLLVAEWIIRKEPSRSSLAPVRLRAFSAQRTQPLNCICFTRRTAEERNAHLTHNPASTIHLLHSVDNSTPAARRGRKAGRLHAVRR